MTQVFSYFTGPNAPFFFPGAPFLAAAGFVIVCALLLMKAAQVARRAGEPAANPLPATTPEA